VFDKPFFLILDLAVGGWAGSPNSTSFPAKMLVDWVRVYRLKP
jgi:beta-glucanase (GH16 family)